jgi:two-component system, chemotaxis family, protein-glutamate methylesterase/glutaminase
MTAPGLATRVLVCDESPDYGEALARFLGTGSELEVVGVCASGEEALDAVTRLTPDLVTIGLDLPGMGAVRAIEAIMRTRPVPIVIVANGTAHGSDRKADGLAAGAMEVVPKALLRIDEPDDPSAVALRHRLRRLARNGVKPAPSPPARVQPSEPASARVIGICASAGGPAALEVLLAGLPADFPLPLLVVQHITNGFMDGLVRRLDQLSPLPVRTATDGQTAGPGVWFPPDDHHLVLDPGLRLRLDGETVVGSHRPSGDVLLQSMASAAGAGAVGVVLTGMGRDAARGVEAIVRAGGSAIAQDEQSSAVFGMPRAAAEAGADSVLPLATIPVALTRLALTGAQA